VAYQELILFDIGGVLFCDPWETLLLTPLHGIAATMDLSPAAVSRVGRALWHSYSLRPSEERQYWGDLGEALGVRIPEPLIRDVEDKLLLPNPSAPQLIAKAASTGASLGVASNNTSFWYAKQVEKLHIDQWAEPELVFLSHKLGATKSTPGRGLFEMVLERLAKARVILVEDRRKNRDRAASLGIHPLAYRYDQDAIELPDFANVIGAAR